jgi:hypothetical protein
MSVVEWPAMLAPLLQQAQIASGSDGKSVCRVDVDVDAQTLLAIHEFEAHLRHRPVQLRLTGSSDCMTGAMNPSFGLGAPTDQSRHIARVRLSFHDLQGGECVEMPASD